MTTVNRIYQNKSIVANRDNKEGVYCGATRTDGGICLNGRGAQTDHQGVGRCWAHEGVSLGNPVAMFDVPAIQDRMEIYLNDPKIYSLDREIALLRAYLELYNKYIAIFKEVKPTEVAELGLAFDAGELTRNINQITRTIGKLVQTKHEIEVGRKYVIDVKSVHVMFGVIGDIIDKVVTDQDSREAINKELNNIVLPMASQ